MTLPTDSKARKETPLYSGFFAYFPDAIAAAARLSWIGNEKHNSGQPLHWSREKSNDHADCILRHVADAGPDWTGAYKEGDEEVLHAVAAFWRAGALAQIAIERKKARAEERFGPSDLGPIKATRLTGIMHSFPAGPKAPQPTNAA